MSEKHLSSQFDEELNAISSHLLEMGGLVEAQLYQFELLFDREIISVIGRRQPTAGDLRLLVALSRSTLNLE